MKLTPIFALAMSVSLVAHAQEAPGQINAQPTKIIGAVSDGRPSPPALPKALPKFTINWSTVHQKKGHKVIINKVQAPAPIIQHPAEPLDQEKVKQRAREIEKWVEDIQQSGGFFTVSATIYDHRISHVRWWHEGEEYAVFSNVDWNHLGGFHEFVGRGKRYNMFLFSGNVSTRQLRKEIKEGYRSSQPDLPKLPQLSERGAAYMMVKGDEKNDAAMDFIEAIHDLYDEHRDKLVKASREREKNRQAYLKRQEQLKNNPPPKPDVIINYWKKKNPIEGKEDK